MVLDVSKIPPEAFTGRSITITITQMGQPPYNEPFSLVVASLLEFYLRALESGEAGQEREEAFIPDESEQPGTSLYARGGMLFDVDEIPAGAWVEPGDLPETTEKGTLH